MEGGDKKEVQAKKAPEPAEGGQPAGVRHLLASASRRLSITYIDQLAGQEYAIEDFKLKTGRIAQDAEGKLELAMVAKRKAPALEVKLSADGKYQFKGGVLSGDVTAKLDESTIKAKFTAAEPYDFEASIDKLNLDRYLTGDSLTRRRPNPRRRKKSRNRPPSRKDTPIDLSALKGINARGKLQVGAAAGARAQARGPERPVRRRERPRRHRAAFRQSLRGHGQGRGGGRTPTATTSP